MYTYEEIVNLNLYLKDAIKAATAVNLLGFYEIKADLSDYSR